jgi:hypothetical protein
VAALKTELPGLYRGAPKRSPPDVVTMISVVRLCGLDKGEMEEYGVPGRR